MKILQYLRGRIDCRFCGREIKRRTAHLFYGLYFCTRECVVRDLHAPAPAKPTLADELDMIARISGALALALMILAGSIACNPKADRPRDANLEAVAK